MTLTDNDNKDDILAGSDIGRKSDEDNNCDIMVESDCNTDNDNKDDILSGNNRW